jgi:hypothetical protein
MLRGSVTVVVALFAVLVARDGQADPATVTVKSGTANGEVVVDGTTHVPMQNGVAHVELAPGDHSLEVVTTQKVPVPFPTRQVVGGSLLGFGVVSLLIAAGFYHEYLSNLDDGRNPELKKLYPPSQTPDSLCAGSSHAPELDEVCRLNDEAKKHSVIAVLTATSGVLLVSAGLIVLLTGGTTDKPKVVPMVAPGSAGLTVLGTFY